jgi:DNA-binding NtrC family response regulator
VGLDRLAEEGGDVVVTDLRMPGLTGMDVLRHVTRTHPGVPVVVLTAYGTVEGAVDAVRSGASDFLMKPVEIPRLRAAVFKAVKERGMRRELARLREEAGRAAGVEGIVGSSRAMEEVFRKIRWSPPPDERAHHGESGTGKELVARAVHALSPRNGKPFLPLNCAAIPETLLESELFGYEKGAFTGATAARPGKLESAEGGTLFLDEVGDVPLAIQAKLLRAIEQKEVLRVGSSQVLNVDVRILAATNQDLKTLVEAKTFREDLYYRLNVFGIVVPPLRERREDIPKLAGHLLELLAAESSAPQKKLAPAALKALLAYRWPGNVRQLRNALETAVLVSGGDVIELQDLPGEVIQGVVSPSSPEPIPLPASRTLTEIERDAIRDALAKTGGNKTAASKLLGIALRTLHRKVKEYGIE